MSGSVETCSLVSVLAPLATAARKRKSASSDTRPCGGVTPKVTPSTERVTRSTSERATPDSSSSDSDDLSAATKPISKLTISMHNKSAATTSSTHQHDLNNNSHLLHQHHTSSNNSTTGSAAEYSTGNNTAGAVHLMTPKINIDNDLDDSGEIITSIVL